MTFLKNRVLSPYNPLQGGVERATGFTTVQENKGVKRWQTPDYARFKLIINYMSGINRKGYSTYFSIDYDEKTGVYDESLAYSKLEKMVKSLRPNDYRIATIFANFTNDLSTKSRNYNWQVAIIRDGKYTFLRDIEYFVSKETRGTGGIVHQHWKVNIQNTLKNFA